MSRSFSTEASRCVDEVTQQTCKYFGIKPEMLKQKIRKREVAFSRFLILGILHEKFPEQKYKFAELFNQTRVDWYHAIKKHEEKKVYDVEYRNGYRYVTQSEEYRAFQNEWQERIDNICNTIQKIIDEEPYSINYIKKKLNEQNLHPDFK